MTPNTDQRLLSKLTQGKKPNELVSPVLLLIAIAIMMQGLERVVGALNAGAPWRATLLAAVLGWVLGKSTVRNRVALVIGISSGTLITILDAGKLYSRLQVLLERSGGYFWESILSFTQKSQPPASHAIQAAFTEATSHTATLLQGITFKVNGWFTNRPIPDPQTDLILLVFLLWCLSIWAAFVLRRYRSPIIALTPGVFVLGVSLTYAPETSPLFTLGSLFGCTFLLIGWEYYLKQFRHWQREDIDYAEGISFDITLWLGLGCLAIIALSSLLSFFSPRDTWEKIQDISQRQMTTVSQPSQSVHSNDGKSILGAPAITSPGELPRLHLLGSGAELSQRVVMQVRLLKGEEGENSQSVDEKEDRYYWRLGSYDIYTGHGWKSSPYETIPFTEGERVVTASKSNYRTLTFEVHYTHPTHASLVFSGELISVNQNFSIQTRYLSQDSADILNLRLNPWFQTKSIEVSSRVPIVDVDMLSSTEGTYPDWVTGRFLQLPENLPSRVLQLAAQLTASAQNPFERVKAIEEYLRSFPYSLDIPAPPVSEDVVDYFLFEQQRGYCDYYASAMVVLARASGVPARLVVGYAPGEFDRKNGVFTVTEADAHSWVDVYFKDIGWVEFEPTSNQPVTGFEEKSESQTTNPTIISAPKLPRSASQILMWSLVTGILLSGMATAGMFLLALHKLRRMPPSEAIVMTYAHLIRLSQKLGVKVHPSQTPYEFHAALALSLNRGKLFSAWLVNSKRIVDLYVLCRYSPYATEGKVLQSVLHSWTKVYYWFPMIRAQHIIAQMHGRLKSLLTSPFHWKIKASQQ